MSTDARSEPEHANEKPAAGPTTGRNPTLMDAAAVPCSGIEGDLNPSMARAVRPAIPVLLVLVSLLPCWMLPVAHCVSNPETATGFYQEELPYYLANGRSAFDRGNGLAYPNPYDPDPAAPTIYVHWLLWLLGLFPAVFGLDPGTVLLTATVIGGVGFGIATWKLVSARISESQCGTELSRVSRKTAGATDLQNRNSALLFMLSMWGGGILVPAGCLAGIAASVSPLSTALQLDPGRGFWFLNWGRNAVFATEAVYHWIVALCWLSEIRRRRTAGTLWCGALATTHPWSGLELLLILNLWRLVQWLRSRDRISARYLGVSIIMLAAFLAYYKMWLPRFEHHRKLEQVWELDWSLSSLSAVCGYALVLFPAIRRLTECRLRRLSQTELFLLCALVVAVGLVFHDRFIKPVQPIHFTRGYIWMPLFLIGLPLIDRWLRSVRQQRRPARVVAGLILMLFVTDNLAFSAIQSWELWTGSRGFHLSEADRDALRTLQSESPDTIVLSSSQTLNYLMPAYAPLRPWIGHQYNTPDYEQRRDVMTAIFADHSVQEPLIPVEVTVVLIPADWSSAGLQRSDGWLQVAAGNPAWQIWERTAKAEHSRAADRSP